MLTLNIILCILAAMTLVPLLVFATECLLGILPRGAGPPLSSPRPSVAVLIPAHDEQSGIAATIASVQAQLLPQDRLIVIADNCTDNTAAVARSAGATVIERIDTEHLGKGYAMEFGVRHLAQQPPEIVLFIDADCRLLENGIDRLARAAAALHRPIQASYLLDPPANPGLRASISAFAFLVKNLVRPLGLSMLALPCPLLGTGMALPWDLAKDAPLAGGNIVEDLQLGVDLAIAGHSPRLCADAGVRGTLAGGSGAVAQRRRWEHGHLRTLLTQSPRLVREGLCQRRFELLAMAMDLAVPPLSLLVLVWCMVMAGAAAAWLAGGWKSPFVVLAAGGGVLLLAVLAAWARFARGLIPLHRLLAAPFYAIWKLPLYLAFLYNRQRAWVRSERPEIR
jgi:glycosyltransferase involved in cell wall biosynthesis